MQFNSKKIEDILGYTFKNKSLLKQAFTRSSYSKENGGLDNEILEFIGDKVLDFCIVELFAINYGKVMNDGYKSSKDEGYLTELKASLVDSESLAGVIDDLKLYKYLIVGNNDKQNNVREVQSVKEDLFEAIIGAVALDCNWNTEVLVGLVDGLLGVMDFLDSIKEPYNPVGKLQNMIQQEGLPTPEYKYQQYSNEEGKYWICFGSIPDLDLTAHAVGSSKKEARQIVAEVLIDEYNQFKKETNEYFNVIGLPNEEDSLQQVNKLVQYGLISKPEYEFRCDYDEDGNPVWTCNCEIAEVSEYYFHNDEKHVNSKKMAQRNAVYGLLCYLVQGETDSEDDSDDDDYY